jgi:uncharacterized protein (DUF1330 family)
VIAGARQAAGLTAGLDKAHGVNRPGREDGPMAKAYWINTFRSVSDPDRLAAYIELAGPAMRASGGRFLARGMPSAAFESGVIERTTLIEFDTVDAAVAAYESPGYQEALRTLGDGAERDLRIIEGAD